MNEQRKIRLSKYILSLGHLCADLAQGGLSAVLPFLIAAYHYDYTTAALLVMFSNIIGSVLQPVFGMLADRKDRVYMIAAGAFFSCAGIALTGITRSFLSTAAAVIISGIGVSMYHPQAAQMANRTVSSEDTGFSMGVFSFGGNMGFTLGPVFCTAAVQLFGLKGMLLFFVPAVLFALISRAFFGLNGEKTVYVQEMEQKEDVAAGTDRWGAFLILSVLIITRSIIFAGINTFLVLYYVDVLHLSEAQGNLLLSVYYATGALAAVSGGFLADRTGYRRVIRISYFILLPALILFAMTDSVLFSVILLIPIGLGISLGYSPMVVSGQRYLPNHMGFASGITLGLAVSVGGILAPVFGKVGDIYDLTAVFWLLAALAVIPVIIAVILPNDSYGGKS